MAPPLPEIPPELEHLARAPDRPSGCASPAIAVALAVIVALWIALFLLVGSGRHL